MKHASKPNILEATRSLLSAAGVTYSDEYVEETLNANKDYPSLYSISAVLNDFNIENVGVRISFSQLLEVPLPAIAYINEDKGKFVVIEKVTPEMVSYSERPGGFIVEASFAFEAKWNGTALLIQPNENSVSNGNQAVMEKRRRVAIYSTTTAVAIFVTLTSFLFTSKLTIGLCFLFVLKCLGAISSVLVLTKDLGLKSTLVQRVCTLGGVSDKLGCDKVTSSKASNVFGLFRLSEVSSLYFIGGLIYLVNSMLGNDVAGSIIIMAIFSVLAFPLTAFSIHYQLRVVKQICPLCMVIVLTIWAEIILVITTNIVSFNAVTWNSFMWLMLSFSIPIIFWLPVKEKIADGLSMSNVKKRIKYFLSSPEMLELSLKGSRKISSDTLNNKIVLNADGKIKVTIVLSLLCPACRMVFKQVTDLSAKYNNVKFEIVLLADDLASRQVARSILATKINMGHASALEHVSNWYNQREKGNNFVMEWDKEQRKEIDLTLMSWSAWARANRIVNVPTVLINDRQIASVLTLQDFEPVFAPSFALQYA